MRTTLERHFAAIGARLEVRHELAAPDYRFDVVRGRRGEYFELRGSRTDDLVVQHVDKRGRHILICGLEHGDLRKARVTKGVRSTMRSSPIWSRTTRSSRTGR
jgi:hypothetical protein